MSLNLISADTEFSPSESVQVNDIQIFLVSTKKK